MIDQLGRASFSVPLNIAEGSGKSKREAEQSAARASFEILRSEIE